MTQPAGTMLNSQSALARIGSGWTRFWFTPSDPIVLSLMRVLVGLVALWWYLSLLPDLQAWFGPEGLFTSSLMMKLRVDSADQPVFAFSLLDWVGSASQLWLVYGLGLASLVLMIAGFLTRLTTIASLIFVLSFLHYSLMVVRPVDDVLAMLMFYLCIGPAGANFSIDACVRQWRQQRASSQGIVVQPAVSLSSAATVAIHLIQIHLALVFAAMAIAQLQNETWWQGTAVWWLMARPDSRLVNLVPSQGAGLAFEYFVNFCTHFIVVCELSFSLLIWNPVARPILLVLGIFVWLGLALISGMVSFSILMLVATSAFLPPETLRSWCARCGGATKAEPATAQLTAAV